MAEGFTGDQTVRLEAARIRADVKAVIKRGNSEQTRPEIDPKEVEKAIESAQEYRGRRELGSLQAEISNIKNKSGRKVHFGPRQIGHIRRELSWWSLLEAVSDEHDILAGVKGNQLRLLLAQAAARYMQVLAKESISEDFPSKVESYLAGQTEESPMESLDFDSIKASFPEEAALEKEFFEVTAEALGNLLKIQAAP